MADSRHCNRLITVVGALVAVGVILIAVAGVSRLEVRDRLLKYHDEEQGTVSRASDVKPEDLVGLSREEIVSRFGPPSTRNFRHWDAAFRLEPLGPFGIDSIWLVLRFGDDRVIEAKVIAD